MELKHSTYVPKAVFYGGNIHFQNPVFPELWLGMLEISHSIVPKFDYFQYRNRKKRPSNFGNKKISKVGGATLEIRVFFHFPYSFPKFARVPKKPKNPKNL